MEGRAKAITAVVGLLTAIVVLMGSLTGQGWLPMFIKAPVQSALPGTQPNENRQVPGPGSSNNPQPGPGSTGGGRQGSGNNNSKVGAYGPDTCIQGYVWREAVSGDHVCVTPDTRDQTTAENARADELRSPTGGDYGPDTCIQGYVWREAVPDDHVCVTPDTRDQTRADNAAASSRRLQQ